MEGVFSGKWFVFDSIIQQNNGKNCIKGLQIFNDVSKDKGVSDAIKNSLLKNSEKLQIDVKEMKMHIWRIWKKIKDKDKMMIKHKIIITKYNRNRYRKTILILI